MFFQTSPFSYGTHRPNACVQVRQKKKKKVGKIIHAINHFQHAFSCNIKVAHYGCFCIGKPTECFSKPVPPLMTTNCPHLL